MRTCIKGETQEAEDELKNAAKECKAEREADPDAFEETYGTDRHGKNAYGKCVSSKVKAEDDEDVEEFKNAAKECKAERADDPEAFTPRTAPREQRQERLGKCVSATVKADDAGSSGRTGRGRRSARVDLPASS